VPCVAFVTLSNDQRLAEAAVRIEDIMMMTPVRAVPVPGTERALMIWDSASFTVRVDEQVIGVPGEDRDQNPF
jgi:hypothetical protein